MRYAIDFGTSNSLLCAVDGGEVQGPLELDPMAADPAVFRSVLYLTPKRAHFGAEAIRIFLEDNLNGATEGRLLRSFKRLLPSSTFSGTIIGNKRVGVEEIIGRFLGEMRKRANEKTGKDVKSAVIGRPALFAEEPEADKLAQERLERGVRAAGFEEVEFVPEPLAAAFRYRLEMKKEEVVLVADFGGGTSDFTVIRLAPRAFQPTDVLAIGGVPVAGDALDGELMRHRVSRQFGSLVEYTSPFGSNVLKMPKLLMEHLCSTVHIPLLSVRENADFLERVRKAALGPDDARTLGQLQTLISDQLGFPVFEAIERCKRSLSSDDTADVAYEYPGVQFSEKVKRTQFAEYAGATTEKILGSLDETLAKAGLRADQIDRVCCTGGTARVKILRDPIEQRFGPGKIDEFRNFTSIVEGLAQWAK